MKDSAGSKMEKGDTKKIMMGDKNNRRGESK
jgi:hypothetical protein